MKRLAFLDPNTYRKQGYMFQANGGSEPGAIGISPSVNTYSDMRMPYQRVHIIPFQLPGIMGVQLGSKSAPWYFNEDMANEVPSFRYPQTLAVNQMSPEYTNNQSVRTGVLPGIALDPYASLPEGLRVPMFGGSGDLTGGVSAGL